MFNILKKVFYDITSYCVVVREFLFLKNGTSAPYFLDIFAILEQSVDTKTLSKTLESIAALIE